MVFEDCGSCTQPTAILINGGRLMFLPWSFLISVYDKLLNSNCKRKSFTFYIISVSKGRFIEQVLTDIWIDFMFIVTLKYPVSITSLNRKQPHVLSFGSCIVGGRTTRHDMKTGLTSMREYHVIQCPPFFLECAVLHYNRYQLYASTDEPSLPSKFVLYYNFKQWHYRLL